MTAQDIDALLREYWAGHWINPPKVIYSGAPLPFDFFIYLIKGGCTVVFT